MLTVNEEGAICGISEIFTKFAEIGITLLAQQHLWLKLAGYPLPQDELLSDAQRSEMVAFCALVEDKLYNCQVLFSLFLVALSYTNLMIALWLVDAER